MHITFLFFTRSKVLNAGVLLLSLAILDSLFTDLGLRNNYNTEANPPIHIVYGSGVFGFNFQNK